MASQYYRLLDAKTLESSDVMPRDEVFDAGAFNTLETQVRVVSTGAGTVKLQHAATLEADAWLDLSGGTMALTDTTNTHVTHSNFLRYVRWNTDNVSGSPVAIIDAIAKE
jgi:hypothetical protein